MRTAENRRALLIILDGMGDRPCSKLGEKTPLEFANTPTMDQLVSEGICGLASPLQPGLPVDTHTGTAPLFGFSTQDTQRLARGPIEAAGIGMEVESGDVVLRANFATFSEAYQLLDRRAGRINTGTAELAAHINQLPPIDGVQFTLEAATGHRGVVRLRGDGLSTEISNTDPGRNSFTAPICCQPLSDDATAIRTAELVNRWSRQAFEQLSNHPVNQKRAEHALPLANGLLLRGAGKHQIQGNLLTQLGVKPVVITAEATILGLAALCNFDTFTHPSFTALPNTDIKAKIEAAKQGLETHPMVILHFKAPDICAHDHNPLEKARFIEQVDQALSPLLEQSTVTVITSDHSTSSETGHHCGDPVPTLLHYPGSRRDDCTQFSEVSCMRGGLGNLSSSSVLLMLLDGMGWLHNYRVKDRWML